MVEMTALEYLKERARMTKNCQIVCADCLLFGYHNGTGSGCRIFECEHTKQAIAIVQKWSKEHPRKTLLQDLLEKYPNAELRYNKFPEICPYSLGYATNKNCCLDTDEQFCSKECEECWNRPLEEEQKNG